MITKIPNSVWKRVADATRAYENRQQGGDRVSNSVTIAPSDYYWRPQWCVIPSPTDPTKVRVYGGFIWAAEQLYFYPPFGATYLWQSNTEAFDEVVVSVGANDTSGYLVWWANTSGTGALPGGLQICTTAADVADLIGTVEFLAVLAELAWDSKDPYGYKIKQWTSDTIWLSNANQQLLPSGTVTGQILEWDQLTKKWLLNSNTAPVAGMTLVWTGTNWQPTAASGYPWGSQYTFGITDDGAGNVVIHNAKARRFGDPQGAAPNQMICYTCVDTAVPILGLSKVTWKWNPTAGLIIQNFAQVNDPIDDGTWIYGVIGIFDFQNGRIVLVDYQQCGIIQLPLFTKAGA